VSKVCTHCVIRYGHQVFKVSMCVDTTHVCRVPVLKEGECRVSERLRHSTAWRHMYILMSYVYSYVVCIFLCHLYILMSYVYSDVMCIFSHPTYL